MSKRTSSRRSAQREGRIHSDFPQLPARKVRRRWPAIEPLSQDHIEAIHEASLTLLETTGMDFLLPEAREILKRHGCDVRSGEERVRMGRDVVLAHVAHAPAQFTIHARNPARSYVLGDDTINFLAVGSPPNCSDLAGGRRPGNFKDYCDFVRLSQFFNAIHSLGGYMVEPMDCPPATRHLDALHAALTLSDKAIFCYSLGLERNLDGIEMARIACGLPEDSTCIFTIVNTNSPLRLDKPMLRGIMEMATRNQAVVITPFTLAGAMAPVTLAGALVQQNAEALAGIAFTQMVRPGAPVVYGGFTSNVDMHTGAPAFGTPEYVQGTLIGGQLARRYNLPYRSSNVNASNAPDGQATYESMMSLWACFLGHVHMVKHGAGWLEGGLCASFEKFVMDCEMIQHLALSQTPPVVDAQTLALEAIDSVGPGGHFFGTPHTLERYETAFYQPFLSDWNNFETWQERGSQWTAQRAQALVQRALEEYEEPPMAADTRAKLDAFVERRRREGGCRET